jgi:hypothetical protein
MKYPLSIVILLLSSPSLADSCEVASSDWTGRVWSRSSSCSVTKSGSTTEIIIGARDTFWDVTGNIGRHIIPGFVWNKNDGWYRDISRDQVIWEGSVKQTSASCSVGGTASNSWDFSNGMRICLPKRGL